MYTYSNTHASCTATNYWVMKDYSNITYVRMYVCLCTYIHHTYVCVHVRSIAEYQIVCWMLRVIDPRLIWRPDFVVVILNTVYEHRSFQHIKAINISRKRKYILISRRYTYLNRTTMNHKRDKRWDRTLKSTHPYQYRGGGWCRETD